MTRPHVAIRCAGCGRAPATDDPFAFRCPNAGADDTDHVMTRILEPTAVVWPEGREANPFVRYRRLFFSYHAAVAGGLTDTDYVELVERLDRAVAEVDGRGFTVTPFARNQTLGGRVGFADPGGVWVKDETGNVSGSHKARHLMGLLILLEVAEHVVTADRVTGPRSPRGPNLAIASCGNAALAAAVLARAGERVLQVFVPTWADPTVVTRLEALGARLSVVPRPEGVTGDPTHIAMQRAVRAGAVPFTCQGSDNGLAIEGGETLGYEMVSSLRKDGATLDRLVVQVGGGALASACVQAFREARALGAVDHLPRIHPVQTLGGYPLKRAYDRLARRILGRLGEDPAAAGTSAGAELIRAKAEVPEVRDELRFAATHRSEFMWPWEEEPSSIARGILDDQTYDWLAIVQGMIDTGGFPVVVSEEALKEANGIAVEATGIDVDHTGSAGVAGLLELKRSEGAFPDERVAVLFTGARR